MKKVTLRELVADKIVFAALITLYYWMWARNDWKDSYQTIQNVIFVFTFFYFIFRASRLKKYKQETIDEMAELNLKRCVAALTLIGFLCALGRLVLTTEVIGYCLMGLLLVLSVIRTVLFCLMDAKGI